MENRHSLFSLKHAEETDSSAIRALIQAARINPIGLNWRRFVIALDSQGEIIGCGQVKPHRDGSNELASIAVTPAWRGRGVARAIIERLLAENPGPLYLTCRASLGPFYERFGFAQAAPQELPLYFRHLRWLALAAQRLGVIPGRLLIMKHK